MHHDTCFMSGQVFIGRKNIRLNGLLEFDVGYQSFCRYLGPWITCSSVGLKP